MNKTLFTQLGLNQNEAIVYEYLLRTGESLAGDIIEKTPLKRGVVYNILDDLVEKDLILEKRKLSKGKKVAHFSPNHPEKLREYIKNQESRLNTAKNALEANFSDILSNFSLISGKPGVRYFEGDKGIKKVLWDSLKSKTPIYTYANMDTVFKYIHKLNEEYATERDRLDIKKKTIVVIENPKSAQRLANYHKKTTQTKFISQELYKFKAVMEIYDNKISYITLSEKQKIGVIIEDKDIYEMHKQLFDFMWSKI